ncbi:MAG: GGDEF domain-containing protein, partial [Synergistaceae bacterium]
MPLYGIRNVLLGYSKTKPEGAETIEDIRRNFLNGQRGVYKFSIDGYSRYIIYEPLTINDWFLINGVAGEVVDEAVRDASVMPMVLFCFIFVSMLLVILLIIMWENRNRALLEEEKARLRVSEEKFRIATEQSGKQVVRFDVAAGTAYQDFASGGVLGAGEVIPNVPQSIIASGIIEPESVDECLNFYAAIARGESHGSSVMKMRSPIGDSSVYYKCDFTVIRDKSGNAAQAVISFFDITEQRKREISYELWRQSVSKLPKDRIIIFEHNLTHDALESIVGELQVLPDIDAGFHFNRITAECAKKNIFKDDADFYVKFLNRERLLIGFYSGTTEEALDFRLRAENDGGFRWIHLTVRMVESPDTHEIKAFLIFEDMHEKKLEMLSKEELIHEDPLTGVLNRKSFAERVDFLIQVYPSSQHAFFMIDLYNFKHVNDSYGHVTGDKLLMDIAASLKSVLRSGDLIGLIGGDVFMVCLKCVPNDSVLARKAEALCQLMKVEVADGFMVSGSIGIAVYPRDGGSFSELYEVSDVAVYRAKNSGRSRYEFYSQPSNERQSAPCKGIEAKKEKSRGTRKLCSCGAANQNNEIALNGSALSPSCMSCVYSSEIAKFLDDSEFFSVFEVRLDEYLTILYANKCYYGMYGNSLGDRFIHCIQPKHRERIRTEIHAASRSVSSREFRLDVPVITGCGDERIVCIYGTFLNDNDNGGMKMVGCIAEKNNPNIQKNMLEQQPAMFSAVVDHADIYYWDYDMRAHTSQQCTSLQEELGIPALIENYPEAWFEHKLIAPEQYDEYRKIHADLRNGAPEVSMDVKLSNGIWYRVKYTNTFDEDGRPLKAYGTAQNIQSLRSTIANVKDGERERTDFIVRAQLAYIFEMSALETFEIDIKTRVLTLSTGTLSKYKLDSATLENVPESMIASGFIHPDSADSFSDFYNEIYKGKPEDSIIVKAKRLNGSFSLVRLSYRMLCDEEGNPYKAVGISEELENIADTRLRFEQEEKLHLLIKHDLIFTFRANLSKDTVTFVDVQDCDFGAAECNTYSELFDAASKYISNLDDLKDFKSKYSAEALTSSYKRGVDWMYNEYKLCTDGTNIIWVSASVQVLTNPANGDVYCFVYVRNVDDRKKQELNLPFRVEYDTTKSFYNKKTMKAIVDSTVKSLKNRDALCVLALIKITNLPEVIERLGQPSVDRLLLSINRKIRYTFENRYVTSRFADDTIALFMGDVESDKWVNESIEYVMQILNKIAFFTTNAEQYASYKSGAAILHAKNADFEKLMTVALSAVESANLLRPTIYYYKDGFETASGNVELIPHPSVESLSLSAAAADDSCSAQLFITCAEILLSGRSAKEAMDGVLAKIGEFYGAERAYILEVDEKNKALDNTYEWCGEGVVPQLHELKGVPLSTVPSFQKAYQEQKVLVIKELTGLVETERTILADQGIMSLFVVPYTTKSIVTGFVG